jgi:excisionase family DNA binding protein
MTLTVAQVAERYGVGQHTVLHWLNSGQLAGINVGLHPGKKKPRWRVSEQALEIFELTRTATPPPPRMQRRKRPAEVIEFYK